MTGEDGSGRMFDGIAHRYDLLNRLTSMGQDRRWRRHAVIGLGNSDGVILDLAAGTCDVALEILERMPGTTVIAADPSLEMLKVGVDKVAGRGLTPRVRFLEAGAENLPLADDLVAGATIAFGIRNFRDRSAALGELGRVIRPGGRLVILELTLKSKGLASLPARVYVKGVIPVLGGLLSGRAQYRYLPKSMEAFPGPSEFSGELTAKGFEIIDVKSFMFGVCHLFVCENTKRVDK